MRGKHGAASANRRERAEMEQRAEAAERRSERLEKELTELRESSQNSVSTLRAALTQARKERDAAASPVLAQAEEKIRALMSERDQANKERKSIQEKWNAAATNVVNVMKGMGLTGTEAMEALFSAIEPDGQTRTVDFSGRTHSTDQILAMDRARGHRHANDLLSDRRLTAD